MTARKTGWVATTGGAVRVRINPWGKITDKGNFRSVYPYKGEISESKWVIPFLTFATKAECEKMCNKECFLFLSWEDFKSDAIASN
tara:strand:+ start:2407 stop:2664 length:258 start_codon:yes stop_codon:yes gene_type:complete